MKETAAGRYELVEKVGRGGMAEIYRAVRRGPGGFAKEVCIKRILPGLGDAPGFEEMFFEEARIAAGLQHANIVQVFDFDRDEGGACFIVMELVDGTSLKKLATAAAAREGAAPPGPGLAAAVARAVLAALDHAWRRKVGGRRLCVVHRDVSPHNILVARSGEIKLADFGIAKAVVSAVRTSTGVVKGKMSYIAPEQAEGRAVDTRADLYALGVVLWELAAGRRLFARQGGAGARVPTPDERRAVEPPARANASVPAPFSDFVMRLLEVEPARRPRDALEAGLLLEATGVVPFSPLQVAAFYRELMGGTDTVSLAAAARPAPPPAPPVEPTLPDSPVPASPPPPDVSPCGGVPAPAGGGCHDDRASREGRHRYLLPALIFAATLAVAAALLVLRDVSFGPAPPAPPDRSPVVLTIPPQAPIEQPLPAAEKEVPLDSSGAETENALVPVDDGAGKTEQQRAAAGKLSVNVRPWARVTVDGRARGFTPVVGLDVGAGVHTVVLENEKLGVKKKLRVKVPAGGTKELFFDFGAGE